MVNSRRTDFEEIEEVKKTLLALNKLESSGVKRQNSATRQSRFKVYITVFQERKRSGRTALASRSTGRHNINIDCTAGSPNE